MLSTSIKPETQAASGEIHLLPQPASSTLAVAAKNYSTVWSDRTIRFPLYLRNTLIVAVLGVVGMTLSSAIVAYGLSRIRWAGRGLVFFLILATMMIPFPVLMVPLYIIFRDLGWTNSRLKPLWVPAWFGKPRSTSFCSASSSRRSHAARRGGRGLTAARTGRSSGASSCR